MTSQENKKFIDDLHSIFKKTNNTSSITAEGIQQLKELKEAEYQFRQDKSKPLEERQTSFDYQNRIHEILGFKQMDEKFRPKANSGGGKGGWIATDEQREKNVKGLVNYIGKDRWAAMSPYEQGTVIALAWGTVKQ